MHDGLGYTGSASVTTTYSGLDDRYATYDVTSLPDPTLIYTTDDLPTEAVTEKTSGTSTATNDELNESHGITITCEHGGHYILQCMIPECLSSCNILETFAQFKSIITVYNSRFCIDRIDCHMTPEVRANLLIANKKLRAYGKRKKVIPCYDEFLSRLPDVFKPKKHDGVIVHVVDPDIFGNIFMSFNVKVSPKKVR